jgi:hypothetical protein
MAIPFHEHKVRLPNLLASKTGKVMLICRSKVTHGSGVNPLKENVLKKVKFVH